MYTHDTSFLTLYHTCLPTAGVSTWSRCGIGLHCTQRTDREIFLVVISNKRCTSRLISTIGNICLLIGLLAGLADTVDALASKPE